jgi:hypothetical protein
MILAQMILNAHEFPALWFDGPTGDFWNGYKRVRRIQSSQHFGNNITSGGVFHGPVLEARQAFGVVFQWLTGPKIKLN